MSRYKPTKHAIYRATTRLENTYKLSSSRFLKDAINKGRPIGDFNGEFFDHLMQLKYAKRSKGISIRVYQNMIVVYNNRSGRIITTYKVPDRFIPVSQFIHAKGSAFPSGLPSDLKKHKAIKDLLIQIHDISKKEQTMELEEIIVESNNVTVALTIDGNFENFGVGKSKYEAKVNALETYLNILRKKVQRNEKHK